MNVQLSGELTRKVRGLLSVSKKDGSIPKFKGVKQVVDCATRELLVKYAVTGTDFEVPESLHRRLEDVRRAIGCESVEAMVECWAKSGRLASASTRLLSSART